MVAVVSGSNLGLFTSSTPSGNAQVGRGRDRVYVNSTTGNLVVQSTDDTLAALGLDFAAIRTYNSQGLTDEDNGDQWRLGVHQRIYNVTGTVGVSGTVTKVFGDGSEVVYTWNTTRNRYESTDGDGANDFLAWNSTNSTWTWTDGSSRLTEEYGLVNGVQRIKFSRDADNNTVTYSYANPNNPSLLSSISMAGAKAQTVYFDYTGNNLTAVRVESWNDAGTQQQTQTLTRYYYDNLNRLKQVVLDLTPTDNAVPLPDANADTYYEATAQQTYITTYTYESNTRRIATITQSDGSSMAFTYQDINGNFRLKTVTDAENRVTTFTYNDVITAGSGQPTSAPAAAGQIFTTDNVPYPTLPNVLTASPAGWNGAVLRESSGTAINDPRIAFDSSGNGFMIWRSGNNVIARRYTSATNSWGPEITLDTRSNTTYTPSLSVDAGGNAIAAWAQSDGTAVSAYAARYDINTGLWGSAVMLDTSPIDPTFPVNTAGYSLVTAIKGSRAVVLWQQDQAASGAVYNLYVARFNGTSWQAPESVESGAASAVQPNVAMDTLGNIAVAFRQNDGSNDNIYVNRFNVANGTWSGPVLRDTVTASTNDPRIAFDANGNGLLVYRTGSDVRAQRYTRSTDQWGTEVTLDTRTTTASAQVLALDPSGVGFAAWVQSDGTATSVYAARFNGTSWDAATLIDTSPTDPTFPVNTAGNTLQISVRGTRAALVWQHNQATSGSVYDLYAARYNGSSWQAPELVESRSEAAAQSTVAVDSLGNVSVAFQQTDGTALSAWVNRYNASAASSYYIVPSGATWQSIANTIYGVNSAAAGTALQNALPGQTLATGVQLGGFPPTLTVLSTVQAYCIIASGDTWSTVAQRVYGTTDANLIAAMQTFAGSTILPGVGQHLNVQTTINYTPAGSGSGPAIYQRTDVQNAIGTTTYLQDTLGRLIAVQTPAVNGARLETRYSYDPATGNIATVTEDPTGLNRVTTFTYDPATGLLSNTRDNLGATVAYTYNARNQLETETRYTVRDPDGGGTGQPSGALITRYIYDSGNEDHLRFVVSADGRVTEHVYDTGPGLRLTTFVYASSVYSGAYTEAALNTWATNAARRGGPLERTDYAYDFRGNISTVTRWATTDANGNGTAPSSVTRYVYDQRGMLLNTVEARGEATSSPTTDYLTSYTYDGLGRRLTASTWVSATETARLVESNLYDDAGRKTVTTYANGLTTTYSFNKDNELVSIANGTSGSLGTTSYTYDGGGRLRVTTDAVLVKTYSFYDDAGRKIGTVDGDGSLVEWVYDRANQVIKTIRYATALTSARMTALSGGSWATVLFSDLRTEANPLATQAQNQITRCVYDASGAKIYQIDQLGALTKFVYDGAGRLTDTIRYKTPVSISATTDEVLPSAITPTTDAEDRTTRHFYNGDGLEIGTLDGAGFLVERIFDAAGRLTKQIGYYQAVDAGRRGNATIDTMRPGSIGSTAQLDARDITTRIFYDAQGRTQGTLDGERYLTEFVYDVAGHVLQTIRYDRALTSTAIDSAFSTFKTAANGAATHTTINTYDGIGQLLTSTNYENTPTNYSYDVMGKVTSITVGTGVDARTHAARYDLMGRVTRELTAEGYAALAALVNPTAAQIEDIWTKWSAAYTYDNAGRRTSATVRPNDTQTNTTYYYYDNDGRLRFELDPRGRVTENRYNALGQLRDRIEYYHTVAIPSQLGGLLTPDLITALSLTEVDNVHEKTTYGHSLRGELTSTLTVGNASTAKTYNIFGEVETSNAGSGFTAYEYTYDARGLQDLTKRGGVEFENRDYDAFGRLSTIRDARGNTFTTTYDRLGRESTSSDPGDANGRLITYDGFSRVLSIRDKLLNTTSYAYNDTTRTVTVTTPENIEIVTTHNVHGEDATVVVRAVGAAAGTYNTTTYVYDKNGQLKSISDTLGALEGRTYDRAGRQVTGSDARGTVTTFAYDAVNRILSRTVTPPAGSTEVLNLVTTYAYDPQNRFVDVTEPGNRVTRTEYDRDGRVYRVTLDPNGAARSVTEYQYDTANNTILKIEGTGTATTTNVRRTRYVYDALGRRIEEIVDPTDLGGPTPVPLNLRTIYKYDNNNNLVRKIDARYIENGPAPFNNARNYSTWYVYDAQNRLTQTIDALGGVTELSYDAEDRVVSTRRYYNTVSTATFGDSAGAQTPTKTLNDQVSRTVYDRNGREKYSLATVSATGTSPSITELAVLTERSFDALGHVTRTRIYRNYITVPSTVSTATIASALAPSGNDPANIHADDHVEWTLYDLRGQPIYAIDGSGAVVKSTYDLSGNVIATIAYADRVAVATLTSDPAVATAITNFVNGAASSNTNNRTTRFWYDAIDRARFALDAMGYLTETRYVDGSNQRLEVVYATKPASIAANATLTDVMSAANNIPNPTLNQTTTKYFDAAGRTIQVTDANGKSEYFGYDAVGNKIKYVNKKASSASDTAYTWTYDYDANGRLINERSPNVSYASVNASTLAVTETTGSIVTHNDYDALGNITARTEANGISGQQRITRFEYDLLGRQTATVSPTVGIYDIAGDTQFGANGTTVNVTVTNTEIRSETSYDVFGNAFRNRLVMATQQGDTTKGAYTFKVYDNLGRVRFEVDAKNQFTENTYDAFGDVVSLKRYANPLRAQLSRTGSSVTIADVTLASTWPTDTTNREVTRTYDRLGRATYVRQPSVRNFAPAVNGTGGAYYDAQPVTENVYDAFGQLIRTGTQINQTDWAYTYMYYDKVGNKTAMVDPGRYLTQYSYDETGDLTSQTEYARPTTGTLDYNSYGTVVYTNNGNAAVGSAESFNGYDRQTNYGYDKLNRKISESKINLEYGRIVSDAVTPTFDGTQTTTYGYDALGNQTRVSVTTSDVGTLHTFTFYDVLGRAIATASPQRDLGDGNSKIGYTRMLRDANGNLVQQIDYYAGLAANYFGATPADAPALPTTPTADANNDRKTTIVVDAQGHALRTRDATGADRYASYTIRGDIAKEWQVVTNPLAVPTPTTETIVKIYRYDAVGQQTELVESQRYNGANTDYVTRVSEYNAFGEITAKYNAGTADNLKQYFDYDATGRLWRTNSDDGVDKVYMYDLAGNATLELRSQLTDLKAAAYTSAQSILNASGIDLMRTETVYDLKGQVVQRRMPSFDIDTRYPPVATDININTFSGTPYVYWTAVNPNMGILSFGYRIAGTNSNYTSLAITSPASGLQGVDVSALTDRTYEFRLVAAFPNEPMPAAESTGTFRADRSVATSYTVTRTPPDPAAEISNLTIIPTAPLPANFSVLQSANYSQPAQGAETQWWGPNRVHGDWEDVGNIAVRVQVTYYKRYRDTGGQTSGTYSAWADFAAGAARTVAEWQILPNDASQAAEGGIHSIVAMRVYAINGDGTTGALLRETNQGAQVNGLVWNAPADQTVTAYFRYKRTTDSTFSADVQATRIGSYFRVNVFPLLTAAATYNYVVEYRRGGTLIAKNEGEISSSGQQTTTTITGSISSNSFSTFNEFVASPSISGLTMSWAPPSQSVTASFEWGTSTAYGNTLGISQSSTWSVNLGQIPQPSSTTTYYYRTVYRQGNRVVSQQTGTFSLTPQSTTVAATASNDQQPTPVPPVSTVSGSSGVTRATYVVERSAKYGVPSGAPPQTQWQWWDVNIVKVNFADVGNRAVRVVLTYWQRSKDGPGPSPGVQTRSMDIPASGSTTQANFTWGIAGSQVQYEGVYDVSTARVYAINADGTTGSLLRDNFASATTPEPPTISWARPADITLVATIRIGGGAAVAPTLFAGRYQYSLSGIASNTFTIDYTRPGDSAPIVSLTGSFTNDGTDVTVTSQTPIDRNPTWIGVSSSGASLSWSRAPESAGDVSFRYKVSGGSWQSLTPTGGPNYSVTFPSSGPNGTTNYIYEVRYVRSGESLPYVLSTGTAAVTVNNIAASATFGSKSDSKYPAQQVVPSLSGNTVSWSFARENAGDTVTFRYSVGGNTYSTNLSGNGPSFSAVMSQLPVGTSTVNWWIEYSRAGESTFYASGSGTASMTVRQDTWPSTLTVLTQRPLYPSGVAEIAAPYNLAGGYLAWDRPPNGATMAFTYNGTPVSVEAYGTGGRVNLNSLNAGTYNYEITYTASGVVTARAVGTFTVVKTLGAVSTMTRSIADQRVNTSLSLVPTIGQGLVVWPPNAVYHGHWGQGIDPNTGQIGNVFTLEYGAAPWGDQAITGSGGFYYTTYPSQEYPNGAWGQYASDYYIYDTNRLTISFPVTTSLGVGASLEYWPISNPAAVKSALMSSADGSTWVADLTQVPEGSVRPIGPPLGAGNYGYRISLRRQGGFENIGVQEGTFVVGTTAAGHSISAGITVTPSPTAVTPTSKQSYDRWGNVIETIDAAGNLTSYRYSGLNQLLQTLEATDKVYDRRINTTENSVSGTSMRVEKTNSYDLLGRLIETQDGYDQATRVTYNATGQQITKRNADWQRQLPTNSDPLSRNVYDVFGNLIQSRDEIGYRTRYKYDRLGRLTDAYREVDMFAFADNNDETSVTPSGTLRIQHLGYRYDEAGRRIGETDGLNQTVSYRYDLLDNVTARRSAAGLTTSYLYNFDGKKISETDPLGSSKSWFYDALGRLKTHGELVNSVIYINDANGDGIADAQNVITYNYDEAGKLSSQTSTIGQNITYKYDRGGNLVSIVDQGNDPTRTDDITVNRLTNYRYDASGRQVRETVIVDGGLHQDSRYKYDGHNRIIGIDDSDYQEQIVYDVNGNRAIIRANYPDHNRRMINESISYKYDEMNRLIQSKINPGGDIAVVRTTDLTYNARGDRILQVAPGRKWSTTGTANVWSDTIQGAAYTVDEQYVYDGIGRLTNVNRNLFHTLSGAQNPTNIELHRYIYDMADRRVEEYHRTMESGNSVYRKVTTSSYDADGRAGTQLTEKWNTGQLQWRSESLVNYGTANWSGSATVPGYDAAGNVRTFTMQAYNNNGGATFLFTYRTSYLLGDGYLERAQDVSSTGTGHPDPGHTERSYNINRELVKFKDTDSTAADKTRYIVNNQSGQALTTIQGNFETAQANSDAWYRALTRTQNGSLYNSSKAQYFFVVQGNLYGSFGQIKEGSIYTSRFDVNTTPISESYPAAVPSTVVVQAGETLRSIAARVFGDSSLWYVIAEENGLVDPDADLQDGMQLRIPNQVISLSNNSDSFKPFDINQALGDTTPTQQPPPAPKGCGVIGMIIMIVVMIVATIFTAGVATAGLGAGFSAIMSAGAATMAAGFSATALIAGAVGSIVSQGVGVLMGMQDGIDWKGVALGAIGSAVGAGIGSLAKGTSLIGRALAWSGRFGQAAATSIITQGIGVATHLQEKFSWREVGVAAVGAVVGDAVSSFTGAVAAPLGTGTSAFISGYATSVSTSLVRRLLGGRVDTTSMLVNAFGDAIMNSALSSAAPDVDISGTTVGQRLAAAFEGFGDRNFGGMARLWKNSPPLEESQRPYLPIPEIKPIGKDELVISDESILAQLNASIGTPNFDVSEPTAAPPSRTRASSTPAKQADVSLDEFLATHDAHGPVGPRATTPQEPIVVPWIPTIGVIGSQIRFDQAVYSVTGVSGSVEAYTDYEGANDYHLTPGVGLWGMTPGADGKWENRYAIVTDIKDKFGGYYLRQATDKEKLSIQASWRTDVTELVDNWKLLAIENVVVALVLARIGLPAAPAGRARGPSPRRTEWNQRRSIASAAADAEAGMPTAGAARGPTGYTYDAFSNPGPLASMPNTPARGFYGGRYNPNVADDEMILYRAGESNGKALGQWYTREPPASVAQARIDNALKPEWVDPKTGLLTGTSNIDTVYIVKIPKGTTYYEGPVGNQGGVYLGGMNKNQIFVQTPWNISGVQVLGKVPLR